jgi:membrane fusion protein (multidrug efflux system)
MINPVATTKVEKIMNRKKTLVGGAAVMAIVLVSTAFLTFNAGPAMPEAAQTDIRPVAVEVQTVKAGTLQESVSAVGTIAAMKDVVVSSETAGRVTAVLVKVGDAVRQAQTLIQVDDELKLIAVEQAKAQMLAAETNYRKAQKDFERTEKLYKAGDVADVEMEGYRLALHSAEAQYKSAAVGLKASQRQLDDTKIKAPISGYVASRKVEVGEMVAPGKEIANLVDLSTLKVKLSIPEEEIVHIRAKQPATLHVDSQPGEVIAGTVYTVGSKSEASGSHSYPVEVVVQNRKADILKVGMFARVEITTASVKKALTVSKETLVNEESNPSVFVIENSVARLRPVRVGLRTNDRVQILEGLKEGDLVVSFGQKGLKDGSTVQYK